MDGMTLGGTNMIRLFSEPHTKFEVFYVFIFDGSPNHTHSKVSGGIFLFLCASIIVCTKDIYNAQMIWNWNILINSTHF